MDVLPSQFDMLSRLLDAAETRHRAISQNVANVDTPGYQRLDVSFEEALAERLSRSPGADPSSVEIEVTTDTTSPARADGNNVDVDREMGQMNKNALLYQTYSQVLASKMAMMKNAITGR